MNISFVPALANEKERAFVLGEASAWLNFASG
jgi:hypothetical protein